MTRFIKRKLIKGKEGGRRNLKKRGIVTDTRYIYTHIQIMTREILQGKWKGTRYMLQN